MRKRLIIITRPATSSLFGRLAGLLSGVLAAAAGIALFIFLLPVIGLMVAIALGVVLGITLVVGIWILIFRWKLARHFGKLDEQSEVDDSPQRPRKKIDVKIRRED